MPSLTGIDLGAKVVAKLTRRLLPFLFLLYIVAYLDRINVGFAALQMRGQLGFSDEVYGLGAGIFFRRDISSFRCRAIWPWPALAHESGLP